MRHLLPAAGRPPINDALRRATTLAAALCVAGTVCPAAADAHGIKGRASLPVPAYLFAWAAAVVLVVSFIALSAMWSAPRLQEMRERRLCDRPAWLSAIAGAVGLALFALVLYAGWYGVDSASANFDPTFIFVVFWVAVPVSSAVLGNWFSAFSPWRALARGVRWGAGRCGVRRPWAALSYPSWLGRWPVVVGLVCFGWLELVYHDHDNPATLAWLSLAYFVLMLSGMALFGIETWSERGDAFGGYFELLSRLSPLDEHDSTLWLRAPLAGAPSLPQETGMVAMVLVIIGITTFDGASNGVVWNNLQPHVQSVFSGLGLSDTPADEIADSLGLALAIGIVSGFYRAGVIGMRSVSRRFTTRALSRSFAHTLVPIAFAYVLAHYFSLLVWQGQGVAHLASDPLGNGANLLGSAHWRIHYSFLGSTAIWYVQVLALLAGHVCGLTLAHDRALATYRRPQDAVRSQYWMLVVMVGFTSLGLWLLSAVNT